MLWGNGNVIDIEFVVIYIFEKEEDILFLKNYFEN